MDVKSCYSALSVEWRTTNRVPPSLPYCVMSGDSWSRLRESLATIDHLLSHALRPLLTSSLCCCARALNTAVIIITIQRPASARSLRFYALAFCCRRRCHRIRGTGWVSLREQIRVCIDNGNNTLHTGF